MNPESNMAYIKKNKNNSINTMMVYSSCGISRAA